MECLFHSTKSSIQNDNNISLSLLRWLFFIPIEWVEYNTYASLDNNYFRRRRFLLRFSIWFEADGSNIRSNIEIKLSFSIARRDHLEREFSSFSSFAPIDFRIYTFNLLFFELILAGCHVSLVGRSITEHCHRRTHGVWCHPWLNCVDVFCSM